MNKNFMPWFAGFWEGEGCLHVKIYRHKQGHFNRHVILKVDQSSSRGKNAKQVMEYIKSQLGFGHVSPRIQQKPQHAPRFFWACQNRAKVIDLLRQMLPYLHVRYKEVKKKLAELESWNKSGIHRYTEEELEEIAKSNLKIKDLAKKLGVSRHAIEWQRKKLGRIDKERQKRSITIIERVKNEMGYT